MSDESVRFKTRLAKTGTNTTGVVVPAECVAKLGAGARPAVTAKINNYTYRTTIGSMKGQSMLPFSAQHREASGIRGGDLIDVELRVDTQPRTMKIPKDLAQALAAQPSLDAAFKKQAPSRQKADMENIIAAKAPETRARRIEAIIARLHPKR